MPQVIKREIDLRNENFHLRYPVGWIRWLRREYGDDAIVPIEIIVTDRLVVIPLVGRRENGGGNTRVSIRKRE